MDNIKKIQYNDRIEYKNSNGLLHNPNGPAIEYNDGTKYYYINGEIHREDGPAIEYTDGEKYYYKHGKLHRLEGPAIISNDFKLYYIDGVCYDMSDFYSNFRNLIFKYKNYLDTNPQNKIDILNIKNAIQNNVDASCLSLLKSLL